MEFAASNAPQNSDRASLGAATSFAHSSSSEILWKAYPGLVWSNRQAGDDIRIRAALMKPQFPLLLDIATTFGPDRLEQEWAILHADTETDTRWVEPIVCPILANIRRGYEQACA